MDNPVRYQDPEGDCPLCLVPVIVGLWLASEPVKAPSMNREADEAAMQQAWKEHDEQVISAIMPANRTKTAVSVTLNVVKKEVGKEAKDTAKKITNPYGAKGKPDHQAKVKELETKAKNENPGMDIVTEKKIQAEGSNRRPDVQVIDPKTEKTIKVYEAERHPGGKRNQQREAEYDRLNIPYETHKVGGD